MNKRPEITARTRQKLTDAFWQLYREKDVPEIRITDITDLAGYHRGTFYEYFTDIYDLLDQEELALTAQLKSSRDAMHADSSLLFSQIIQFYQASGERVSLLFRHGNMSFVRRMKETLYPMFLSANNLEDSGKSAVIYEFGINGLLMSFDYWYSHQDRMSLQEFISVLQGIIENGIMQSLAEV